MFPALHLCIVLPFLLGSFCRLSVVRLRCWSKSTRHYFRGYSYSPSERNQNIQNNLEYKSVLPFRIILKVFAVNMLLLHTEQTRKPIINVYGISKMFSNHLQAARSILNGWICVIHFSNNFHSVFHKKGSWKLLVL